MDLRHRGLDARPGWNWPRGDEPGTGGGENWYEPHAAGHSSQAHREHPAAASSGYEYQRPRYAEHVPFRGYMGGYALPSDASDTTDHTEEAVPDPQVEERRRQLEEEQRRFRRRYKPRTCRICLEVVNPTFDVVNEEEFEDMVAADNGGVAVAVRERVAGAVNAAIPTFLRPKPRVQYLPQTPEDGRLISPCHCKGSQKYVHEGCLKAWRHSQPLRDRNYWKCPTCGFEYRLERLSWGRLISNRLTRAFLTFVVFWLAIFLLGFVADPLIDMWLDPGGMIADTFLEFADMDIMVDDRVIERVHNAAANHVVEEELDFTGADWVEHFLKGFFSLGIFGVVKTFLAVSPFTWWNLRGATMGRARRRVGGQARIEGFGWAFVIIGAFTFLGVVWKGISYLSGYVLDKASERVVDIQGDTPDDSDDEDDVVGNDDGGDGTDGGGDRGENMPDANSG